VRLVPWLMEVLQDSFSVPILEYTWATIVSMRDEFVGSFFALLNVFFNNWNCVCFVPLGFLLKRLDAGDGDFLFWPYFIAEYSYYMAVSFLPKTWVLPPFFRPVLLVVVSGIELMLYDPLIPALRLVMLFFSTAFWTVDRITLEGIARD
jgi:hypothetical protein